MLLVESVADLNKILIRLLLNFKQILRPQEIVDLTGREQVRTGRIDSVVDLLDRDCIPSHKGAIKLRINFDRLKMFNFLEFSLQATLLADLMPKY